MSSSMPSPHMALLYIDCRGECRSKVFVFINFTGSGKNIPKLFDGDD